MQISPKFLSSFFLNKLAERESERDLISPKLMSSFFPQQTSKEKRERDRERERGRRVNVVSEKPSIAKTEDTSWP